MGTTENQTYGCGLMPFVPNDNDKRTIVLLDDGIERTIKSSGYSSIKDFERLVDIYRKLQELSSEGSTTTHLQTVKELRTEEDGSLVLKLSPVGDRCRPTFDEVGYWLRDMLTALKFWHRCGYCHGDVRWRNIVVVSKPGSSYWLLIDMDESYLENTKTIDWNHQCKRLETAVPARFAPVGQVDGKSSSDTRRYEEDAKILLSTLNEPELTAEDALARLTEFIH